MTAADDELAVRAAVASYSDAVMCRDAQAAASVFAVDGVLQAFGGPEVVGRAAIEAALASRFGAGDFGGFSVQMTMPVAVRLDGDRADVRSHYLEMSRGSDDTTGRLSMGTMEDTFGRGDDGWRIRRRRLTRVYVGDVEMPGKVTPREMDAWLADRP